MESSSKALVDGIDLEAFRRAMEWEDYVSSLCGRARFYAQVEQSTQVPAFRVWSDCRIYLEVPLNPQREDMAGCLGTVWLHNPSTAFQIAKLPHIWGDIPIRNPKDPRSATVNYVVQVIQRARDKLRGAGVLGDVQNPYINLAELVYIDSPSKNDLWWSLGSEAVRPYSHVGNLAKHAVRGRDSACRFLWLAWGELDDCSFKDKLFRPLTAEAIRRALATELDLVLVTEELDLDPIDLRFPVFQWSARRKGWRRYWSGVVEVPGSKDEIYRFLAPMRQQPQHPQSLRTLSCPKLRWVEDNLVETIADSLSS